MREMNANSNMVNRGKTYISNKSQRWRERERERKIEEEEKIKRKKLQ